MHTTRQTLAQRSVSFLFAVVCTVAMLGGIDQLSLASDGAQAFAASSAAVSAEQV